VGVVVLCPPPVAVEVDTLRRALGDPTLGRIPAHVTLVPPLNLRSEHLPAALARLRRAAEDRAGFDLLLGPVTTFDPVSPTIHLEVSGQVEALLALRDAVFGAPLYRPVEHPFVPHCTLVQSAPLHRIRAAATALAGYAVPCPVDTVVMLEERHDSAHHHRRWVPVADVRLGAVRTVGRGGLPVTLAAGAHIDPLTAARWPRLVRAGGLVVSAWSATGEVLGAIAAPGEAVATEDGDLLGVAEHLEAEFAFRQAELSR
jgi:2'-5' RNA ligase